MLIQWLRPHYEEDDGKNGGGAESEGGKVRASELRAQLGTTVDEQALMRFLEKHADVLNDNHRLREQRSALKQQLQEAKGKVPDEGAVILTKADAAALESYKALGADAPSLKAAMTERDEAKARLLKLERDALIRDVAAIGDGTPYRPSVLAQLPGVAELTFEVRDVEKDGGKAKAAFVKSADGQARPLVDYATEHWADFLPALRIEQSTAQGTAYVQQSSGGKPPVKNLADEHIERQETKRKAQTNPLLTRQQRT